MPSKFIATFGVITLCFSVVFVSSVLGAEQGIASYYGAGEPLNPNTAMNIPFDPRLMECASWDYPLGSVLQVTSVRTGRSVIVRVTDRGPARRLKRLLDLTREAFSAIDNLERGLTQVQVKRLR